MLAFLILSAPLALRQADATAGTFDAVKKRGHVICGVSEGLPGFSLQDANKTWRGFDVDFCRAVAAAIFGSPQKVAFVPLTAVDRFDALSSGKIDLLARNTTWTLSRDIGLGLDFAGVSYYDGQGFMTRSENGLTSALQLSSARICLVSGTTSVQNAQNYFDQNNIKVTLLQFEKRQDATKAYVSRQCDAYSADRSALASERTQLEDGDEHIVLPEVISKEPLGPVTRQDDPVWSETVRWVLFLLINGEEAGWTSANAAKGAPTIQIPQDVNAKLGLDANWAAKVIGSVGNYGEIFDRNLGKDSPLRLGRGINALWSDGGILYAPPMR